MTTSQLNQTRQYLEDIQNTAQESLADMRLLIFELRPPILEKEGLIAALQNRLLTVENRTTIKASLQSNLLDRISPEIEQGLYQIAREALNNILKHAHAKTVLVSIQQEPSSLWMDIVDDGVGFDPGTACRKGCMGMGNMQEHARSRGWRIQIESSPGKGTRVRVEIQRT
jgi:signal transduction histidine kinase